MKVLIFSSPYQEDSMSTLRNLSNGASAHRSMAAPDLPLPAVHGYVSTRS